ncbi:hypothetical protein HGRIS_003750 [Hohenbuehelia grisea]|uniref:Trichoplein multi-domain protein n=1 Tax=Hohenbuehelia grisea TaxID=104357 RepID=A0ABR3JGP2_9AGAR
MAAHDADLGSVDPVLQPITNDPLNKTEITLEKKAKDASNISKDVTGLQLSENEFGENDSALHEAPEGIVKLKKSIEKGADKAISRDEAEVNGKQGAQDHFVATNGDTVTHEQLATESDLPQKDIPTESAASALVDVIDREPIDAVNGAVSADLHPNVESNAAAELEGAASADGQVALMASGDSEEDESTPAEGTSSANEVTTESLEAKDDVRVEESKPTLALDESPTADDSAIEESTATDTAPDTATESLAADLEDSTIAAIVEANSSTPEVNNASDPVAPTAGSAPATAPDSSTSPEDAPTTTSDVDVATISDAAEEKTGKSVIKPVEANSSSIDQVSDDKVLSPSTKMQTEVSEAAIDAPAVTEDAQKDAPNTIGEQPAPAARLAAAEPKDSSQDEATSETSFAPPPVFTSSAIVSPAEPAEETGADVKEEAEADAPVEQAEEAKQAEEAEVAVPVEEKVASAALSEEDVKDVAPVEEITPIEDKAEVAELPEDKVNAAEPLIAVEDKVEAAEPVEDDAKPTEYAEPLEVAAAAAEPVAIDQKVETAAEPSVSTEKAEKAAEPAPAPIEETKASTESVPVEEKVEVTIEAIPVEVKTVTPAESTVLEKAATAAEPAPTPVQEETEAATEPATVEEKAEITEPTLVEEAEPVLAKEETEAITQAVPVDDKVEVAPQPVHDEEATTAVNEPELANEVETAPQAGHDDEETTAANEPERANDKVASLPEHVEEETAAVDEPELANDKVELAPQPEQVEGTTTQSVNEPELANDKVEVAPEPERVEEESTAVNEHELPNDKVELATQPEHVEETAAAKEPELADDKVEVAPQPLHVEEKAEAVAEALPVDEKIELVAEPIEPDETAATEVTSAGDLHSKSDQPAAPQEDATTAQQDNELPTSEDAIIPAAQVAEHVRTEEASDASHAQVDDMVSSQDHEVDISEDDGPVAPTDSPSFTIDAASAAAPVEEPAVASDAEHQGADDAESSTESSIFDSGAVAVSSTLGSEHDDILPPAGEQPVVADDSDFAAETTKSAASQGDSPSPPEDDDLHAPEDAAVTASKDNKLPTPEDDEPGASQDAEGPSDGDLVAAVEAEVHDVSPALVGEVASEQPSDTSSRQHEVPIVEEVPLATQAEESTAIVEESGPADATDASEAVPPPSVEAIPEEQAAVIAAEDPAAIEGPVHVSIEPATEDDPAAVTLPIIAASETPAAEETVSDALEEAEANSTVPSELPVASADEVHTLVLEIPEAAGTVDQASDVDAVLKADEAHERPKSPWTPSYSVTTTGAGSPSIEPVLNQEPESAELAEGDLPIIVTPAEEEPQPDIAVELKGAVPLDIPERPKSPWTPSYSTTTQGSPSRSPTREELVDEIPTSVVISPPGLSEPIEIDTDAEVKVPPVHHIDEPEVASGPDEVITIEEQNASKDTLEPEHTEFQQPQKDETSASGVETSALDISTTSLEAQSPQIDAPERPQSPWTPSYSVTSQGSPAAAKEVLLTESVPEQSANELLDVAAPVVVEVSAPGEAETAAAIVDNEPVTETSSTVLTPKVHISLANVNVDEPVPEVARSLSRSSSKENLESATDLPERPKSPWTPSYSVMSQGSPLHSPRALEPIQGEEISTLDAPVAVEPVAESTSNEESEPKTENGETRGLQLEGAGVEAPERPKSPWTPSYSVTQQGTPPTSDAGPSLPITAETLSQLDSVSSTMKTADTLDAQSELADLSIATQSAGTPKSSLADLDVDTFSVASGQTLEPPEIITTVAEEQDGANDEGVVSSSPLRTPLAFKQTEISSDVEYHSEDLTPGQEIAEANPLIVVSDQSVSEEATAATADEPADRADADAAEIKRDDAQPQAFPKEDEAKQPAEPQTRPFVPRLAPVDEQAGLTTSSRDDTDVSPTKPRSRLESTASSRFFPGGWFSSSPKIQGRPSLDVAQGEFTPSKTPVDMSGTTAPAPTPVDGLAEDEEKKAKWCTIM